MRPDQLIGEADIRDFLAGLVKLEDTELVVLKSHLMIERLLVVLLSDRLGVDETELPEIGFARLSSLALAGGEFTELKGHVRALNRLRNHCSHTFASVNEAEEITRFLDTFGLKPIPAGDMTGEIVRMACKYLIVEISKALSDRLEEPEAREAALRSYDQIKTEFERLQKNTARASALIPSREK